jgi:hypothetical protein
MAWLAEQRPFVVEEFNQNGGSATMPQCALRMIGRRDPVPHKKQFAIEWNFRQTSTAG